MRVFVTGGAGYIGSVLVPRLLGAGHEVTVFDRMFFGKPAITPTVRCTFIVGDIRDQAALRAALTSKGFDAVIHLAAVSNDPGSDIDAELTKQINLLALGQVMTLAKELRVPRFLYASSASVYGVNEAPNVHEDLPLAPLTLYAKYKAEGERLLNGLVSDEFVGVSVRSATVCGASPRLRLDLTVNIFSHQAITRGELTIFGGSQKRPNLHVRDLAEFYLHLLTAPAALINGQAFNVTHSNATVAELAECVRRTVAPEAKIVVTPTNDLRSYSLSPDKTKRVLGFAADTTVETAVRDIKQAYDSGAVPTPESPIYRNVEWMKRTLAEWAAPAAVS